VEHIETVKPHARSGGARVKARRREIQGAERALIHPPAFNQEARHRIILWHSTAELRALLVAE